MTEAGAGGAGPTRSALLRGTLAAFAAATLGAPLNAQTRKATPMQQRKVASTGEALPVVGCGTWRTFDVGPAAAERAPRAEVLEGAVRGRRLGDRQLADVRHAPRAWSATCWPQPATRDKAFLATKVWTQRPRRRHRADGAVAARCCAPTAST